jgi:hypothetical protein
MDFLKEACKKIKECSSLEFIPRILIQSKVDKEGVMAEN